MDRTQKSLCCLSVCLLAGLICGQFSSCALADVLDNESCIERSLNTRGDWPGRSMSLLELAEYLNSVHGLNAVLDEAAIEEQGGRNDSSVKFGGTNVRLKSALAAALDPVELTWVIAHEFLIITSKDEAENHLHTIVYDVRDLVRVRISGGFGADNDTLIDAITSNIAPNSWDDVGGPGSISPVRVGNTYTLVISQTPQIHDQIADLFAQLRRAGGITERSVAGSASATRSIPIRSKKVYSDNAAWRVPRVYR